MPEESTSYASGPRVDLSEASRLLHEGLKLCKLHRYSKRPVGDEWSSHPVRGIDLQATGYGLMLAANSLCSLDPDRNDEARIGLAALRFDLHRWMEAGVRTVSTRPGSGGRSTFAADGDLGWIKFTGKRLGTVLELRAHSPNLQDAIPGVVYASNDGEVYQQTYGNCKRLGRALDMPQLPDDLQEWWERCVADIDFLHAQQTLFFQALGDEPRWSVSTENKEGKIQLAFSAPGWRAPFNEEHKVEEFLDKHGYKWHPKLKRWSCPNSTGAPGIRQIPGRDGLWRSDHASDALCGTFDAWTAYVVLEHDGDLDEARRSYEPPKVWKKTGDSRDGERDDFRDAWDDAADPKPEKPKASRADIYKILPGDQFLASVRVPEWLIEGLVPRGQVYSLTGATGSGKTAIAATMQICIAMGAPFAGRRVEQGRVLVLAGENPDDYGLRLMATAQAMGVDYGALAPIGVIRNSFGLGSALAYIENEIKAFGPVVAVCIDTTAAFFSGGDENSNVEMIEHARHMRRLAELPGRPAVISLSHPTKTFSRDNLLPRGGGAFLNEIDGNLTAWRDEAIVALHWGGKRRGLDFDPVQFELRQQVLPGLVDQYGQPIASVAALPVSIDRAAEAAQDAMSRDNRVLLAMLTGGGRSIAALAAASGLGPGKGAVSRALDSLSAQKLARKNRAGKWVLTPAGKTAAQELTGEDQPEAA